MKRLQRGDTLIEVMLAIVILSMIIVTSITLTGFGIGQTESAVEHSQVRTALNGQGDILEYLRDQYIATGHSGGGPSGTWTTILSMYLNNTAAPTEVDTCNKGQHAFYLKQTVAGNTLSAASISTLIGSATGYAQPGQGIWIDAYRPVIPGGNPKYIDFVIKGCWSPIGNGPQQQEASIVRLYDGN